ncbi:UNVERIFIED_CONTAM: hypothetical protein GTU68_028753 [Idotea baltica]|nr:hypothetical protein [Idotea baltica]
MLFCSVVSASEPRPGLGFFALSVDYQEKFGAIGRIPGNFFKRETRLNDYEILTSRLVDRAIRPLFPDGYMNETQVIINLISADEETMPDAYAALAASAALAVSNIVFDGPLSEVRVAKIDGKYVINPGRTALATASLELIVAATKDNVMMVEGEAKECSELEVIEAIKVAHEAIIVQCDAQIALAEKVAEENEDIKSAIADIATAGILKVAQGELDKVARKEGFKAVKTETQEKLVEKFGEEYMEENGHFVSGYFDKLKKATIRLMMLDESKRLDGRKFDEVRPIWVEVDYLPSAHGSAIFNRGETQALTSLTLGSKMDQQMVDTALVSGYDKFILHYNFPALSVGEIKPMRGPGRREVGHANLAGRSLRQVLPEDHAYTIRIVSDILESNGSSSMATVCAGSMALMDAGIPIKSAVSGIAMGMVAEGDRIAVLSDILGDEDALGDMDFKVTGTENGITACQMDIKIDGLPYETLEKALNQAKEGRLHILNEMKKAITTANDDFKPHAPRIESIIIEKDFIGAVIGPGGKIIQELQAKTGTIITIEEKDGKGHVNISSNDKDALEAAKDAILKISHVPEIGNEYEGIARSLMPYGVFVDFAGKSGLLHISEISHSRVEKVEDVFKEGDKLKVKILDIDKRSGKIKLSRKALMPKPERKDSNNS